MAGGIDKNMIIKFNNDPYIVIDKEFYAPAKGGSFTRTKMKNLKTGQVINRTFRTGEKLEELTVETRNMQFVYNDEKNAYFMDRQTFEQTQIPMNMIEGGKNFLHSEEKYLVMYLDEKPISVQLPPKVSLMITETSKGFRGDTATNATKEATVETGFKLQVPLFIKEGEKIIINTETGTYFSKAE